MKLISSTPSRADHLVVEVSEGFIVHGFFIDGKLMGTMADDPTQRVPCHIDILIEDLYLRSRENGT